MKKAGPGIKGKERVKEHPDRTAFLMFIRVSQYQVFNPDRPRITGMWIFFILLSS